MTSTSSPDALDEIVEINAELAAVNFQRQLASQGGPMLDAAALEILVATFKVHLLAVLLELNVVPETSRFDA